MQLGAQILKLPEPERGAEGQMQNPINSSLDGGFAQLVSATQLCVGRNSCRKAALPAKCKADAVRMGSTLALGKSCAAIKISMRRRKDLQLTECLALLIIVRTSILWRGFLPARLRGKSSPVW
jgi:hypothetical protein